MMAHSPSPKFLLFSLALLYLASSCSCQAQDAIQIVAKAALCFDNKPVIKNCLTSMGIITNGTSITGNNGTSSAGTITNGSPGPKQKRNATSVFCGSPCYGQMMMMAGCVDGIMSSFQFYSPGLLQGMQAVFKMACFRSNNTNATSTTTTAAAAFSNSHAAVNGGGGGVGASNGGHAIVKPTLMYLLMFAFFVW